MTISVRTGQVCRQRTVCDVPRHIRANFEAKAFGFFYTTHKRSELVQ